MYHGEIFPLKSEGSGRVRSSVRPIGLDLDVGGTQVGVTEDIPEPDLSQVRMRHPVELSNEMMGASVLHLGLRWGHRNLRKCIHGDM